MEYVYTKMVFLGMETVICKYPKRNFDKLSKGDVYHDLETYQWWGGTFQRFDTNYIHSDEIVITEEEANKIIIEMELEK